jgi:hypothetical protein
MKPSRTALPAVIAALFCGLVSGHGDEPIDRIAIIG